MRCTIEKLKERHPAQWEERLPWCKKSLVDYQWRWEFIRRSPLFREQCNNIRARLECIDGEFLPYDTELDRLCYTWQLRVTPSPGTKTLYLDYESVFFELLTGLYIFYQGEGWRGQMRTGAEGLCRVQDCKSLPGDYVRVCEISGPDEFYQDIKVSIPPNQEHQQLFREIAKDPPRLTHRPKTQDGTVSFKVPLTGWRRFPLEASFDYSDLGKIVKALVNAYGEPLPGVVPWTGRARTTSYANHIKALDAEGLKNRVKVSGLGKNYARNLKTAQGIISRLEAIATARQQAFTSPD